jgi:hypothetical protein
MKESQTQQLADDAPAAGADGTADGELMPARAATRQQKDRAIGAADDQQEHNAGKKKCQCVAGALRSSASVALGAPRKHVLWVAARIALVSAAAGMVMGLAVDSFLGAVLAHWMQNAFTAGSLFAAAALLALCALLACLLPARHAIAVAPGIGGYFIPPFAAQRSGAPLVS